jgi:hypothetical protein
MRHAYVTDGLLANGSRRRVRGRRCQMPDCMYNCPFLGLQYILVRMEAMHQYQKQPIMLAW